MTGDVRAKVIVLVGLALLSVVAIVAGYESGNRYGYVLSASYFLLMLMLGRWWTRPAR
jgi:hypothetical protein